MLIKHGAIYLLSRIIPGLVAFTSLVVYTRLLTPDEYGAYILVITTMALVQVNLFSWLDLSLLRILPAHHADPRPLLSTVLGLFLLLVGAITALALLVWLLIPDPVLRKLLLLGIPILWVHAWLELNLKLCQSSLMPIRYGILLMFRSVATLGLGVALVLHGLGEYGPLVGFLVGSALACVATLLWQWRGIRPRIDWRLARELAVYGIPLTGSIALVFIIDSADRFLLARFLGSHAVGVYSAAYDLAAQSLQVLMMAVNLAAYPLAIRAYEAGGIPAALEQLRQNGNLLFAIAIPAAAGMIVLTEPIAGVLLGESYREAARTILPWIAVAVFVAGLKVFFFDMAFQLSKRSLPMMWSVAAGAVINVLLNLWWIPTHGLVGAAAATVSSYVVALAICIAIGRRFIPITPDFGQLFRILLSVAVMVLAVSAVPARVDPLGLAMQISVGMLAYGLAATALDVLGMRSRWLGRPGKGSATAEDRPPTPAGSGPRRS
ncbi:MAG: oligosaccharide flippase family protein [Burkholderiaceae bacterium]|jgi:O-antigen/teichoic acid export membrane protein|nr:oligosaccharide flippase family protein [Gemmatimonadales bacterium]MCO5119226.1 oligosaccharide flippase family protein [Burkholderiaceae bacterium]